MKYYIIAGEASGDLHGSNLMKAISVEDAQADFRIWGGNLMEASGGQLVKHYRDLAFMGFLEVVKNIRTIRNNFQFCRKDILAFNPDVLILIDYPGFNLRMAKWAKQNNVRVFYYISPQIWAWNASRVHQIKKNIDRMFVILPFEKAFYKKYDYEVDFVGHPLLDVIHNNEINQSSSPTLSPYITKQSQISNKPLPIIALLPGSRRQEISKMLAIMLAVVDDFENYQFVIAGAPSVPSSFYKNILQKYPNSNIKLLENKTYDLLKVAKAALVTSGTATLETALFRVPQIVCYRGNSMSYQIAKRLIRVKYISLVNLILDKPLVKELIQEEFNVKTLKENLQTILSAPEREKLTKGYDVLIQELGNSGASKRTAKLMWERLNKKDL